MGFPRCTQQVANHYGIEGELDAKINETDAKMQADGLIREIRE